MTQTSLFDAKDRPAVPARPPEVDPSRAAREAIAPAKTDMHRRIVALLREAGPLTDEELQERLAMNPSTERPRRGELVEAGVVKAVDRAGRSKAGLPMTRWGLVPTEAP